MLEYLSGFGIDYLTLLILNLILSTIAISLERKNPTSALAWLFFMAALPGIGFFFFILLSQNISKRKIFKYTAEEKQLYTTFLTEQARSFERRTFQFKQKALEEYSDMILFHNRLSEAFFSQNNDVTILTDGEAKFSDLFAELRAAAHHIHMLYYIVQNDALGRELLDILQRKAEEGVEVRLLLDHVGSRSLSEKRIEKLRRSGCEVAFFFPSKLKYFNFKANYRNHRKIVVIDGLIGYVGGFNVGREYIGQKKQFGYWRDTHLKIVGDCVISLQIRFFLDWRHASKKLLEVSTEYIKESPAVGDTGIQIVSSGPDSLHQQIKQGMIKMINKAKCYIYIQTPYFIPDESILEALRIASVSGVDVRIMIPSIPDHLFVQPANMSYVGDLLPYGVRIYQYENGFLHAKTMVVDDIVSTVGTCNFDIRSFKLNFEVNAFLYDAQISRQLREIYLEDLKSCTEITPELYETRSLWMKIKETVSRLFSPIL